jgi:hypothetical protein
MDKRFVGAALLGLTIVTATAFADDKAAKKDESVCMIVSINGKDSGKVVEGTTILGEGKCKLSGTVQAGKEIKADVAKYCGDQNGGKVPVVLSYGPKDKGKEIKSEQTCPFDPRKKK